MLHSLCIYTYILYAQHYVSVLTTICQLQVVTRLAYKLLLILYVNAACSQDLGWGTCHMHILDNSMGQLGYYSGWLQGNAWAAMSPGLVTTP